jgi:hypothetical protein
MSSDYVPSDDRAAADNKLEREWKEAVKIVRVPNCAPRHKTYRGLEVKLHAF